MEDLGLYLKNLREEKKISLAQVAQALKTKPETILALEANDFQKIPAPTYVKGYLRSYANYLGIDAEQLLAEYNRQYPGGSKQVLVLEGQKLPRIGLDLKKILSSKLFIIVSTTVVIIIAASIFVIFRSKKNIPPPKESPAKEEAAELAEPKTVNTPIATPMLLSVHTLDRVWLRVYSDGKLIFEGTLERDDRENWRAESEFKLRIGNPSKLNLSLNGQSLGAIRPYGPVNVVIDKEGVRVEK